MGASPRLDEGSDTVSGEGSDDVSRVVTVAKTPSQKAAVRSDPRMEKQVLRWIEAELQLELGQLQRSSMHSACRCARLSSTCQHCGLPDLSPAISGYLRRPYLVLYFRKP